MGRAAISILELPWPAILCSQEIKSEDLVLVHHMPEGVGKDSLLDVLENDAENPTDSGLVFNDSLKVETMRALSTLTPRERDVIVMSFGIGFDNPYTLEEIGDVMGLTRERVRQIREKALQKLREPGKNMRLKEFTAN